ncbi:MAG TPA: substrate-binding domain-containing protein [Pseudonocardiaceae bacterium]|nr:substrate-binding domain-containing protein [Pseudonocardiaceae bacterium]
MSLESLNLRLGSASGTLRCDDGVLNVALVIPLQGPAGIFGPSCELCAQLAAEEVNTEGGVLGRELRLLAVDGGAAPTTVAAEVEALVSMGVVGAITGWHISAVRREIVPRISGRVPYVYTAVYEGGEHTPGVFVTGETPHGQLLPGMALLTAEFGVRRWCVVGNDYIWPRRSARAAHRYARDTGTSICDEIYVPLGTEDFDAVLTRVARSGADAVLILLVGDDAVRFNRAFGRAGLDQQCRRLATLMDENMLLATGATGTVGLYATSGYFETLATPESLDFAGRYARRFGVEAPPVGNLGESCYEGVRLLAALIDRARTTDVPAISAVADSVRYAGPRGEISLRNRHVAQRIYLAAADAMDFHVLTQL